MNSFLEYWNNIFRNKIVFVDELEINFWLKDIFIKIKGCFYDDLSCEVFIE